MQHYLSYYYLAVIVLRRKVYEELLRWKSNHKKCLVVKGQRQVGKSFIIERFGENEYDDLIRIDFSQDDGLVKLFSDRRVDEMIKAISIYTRKTPVPGKTLLFLDEIQECPQAYSALKSFSLDGRYDVIASGSLLGIERKGRRKNKEDTEPLIPLGYEEDITMFGLDFEEFLWAMGVEENIINDVRESVRKKEPINDFILERFTRLFREYMVVGGMPESVQTYVDSNSFSESGRVLDGILNTCIRDINRYNEGIDILKTTECFESIPGQLAQSNKKFMYSRISGEGSRRSSDKYMGNLMWIMQAGYGNCCYALRSPELFLKSNMVKDHFKVYFSDTGMLLRKYGHNAEKAIFQGDLSVNIGALAENVVAECLMKAGIPPYYYSKRRNPGMMEIDFILECEGGVVAVEVKSGKDRDAPSIEKIDAFFSIERKIKLENTNVFVDGDGVEHYPFFAAAFARDLGFTS